MTTAITRPTRVTPPALFVDGEPTGSPEGLDVVDPATGEINSGLRPVEAFAGMTPDDDVPLVAEEQFGPVLPLLVYDDLDEAVTRANSGPYGLGASAWSPDPDAAAQVATRLDAGSVRVNQHPALSPDAPFGGHEQSGVGVESSLLGLHAYTDVSVLRIKR